MKYHLLRSIVLAALTLGIPSVAFAGTVKVSIHDGRVTVVADDVPLRQILDEWARVGQTRIMNADKISGPAVTLQLVDVPEREALDTLLRSVSGYIAAPRAVMLANASLYDRITIMPTSHAPAMSASAAPVPVYQRPPMERDDDDMPVNVALQQQLERAQMMERAQQQQQQQSPTLTPYPGMQQTPQNQQGPGMTAQPGLPGTSSRPGGMPPAPGGMPQTPAGMPNPYQPSVVRPVGPGGPGGGGN
jgi:hypothetical protein